MAWEERGNKRYYYRKHRQVDGKVVSEYMGHGSIGALFAQADGVARYEHTMARLALQDLQRQAQRVDRAIVAHRRNVHSVVADVLHALGFHQHHGQWRLKRGEARTMTTEMVKATQAELEEYHTLRKEAEGKNSGPELAQLREYVQKHPNVFDGFYAFTEATFEAVIHTCTPSDTNRIQLRGEADALRRRLGIAAATPIERLLIDDVTVCWMRMQAAEQAYSQVFGGSMTFAMATFWERRLSATRRRYLQSIESLARVRGLLARVGIQVNIAQQQIVNG